MKKIAILTHEFPVVSETFIVDHALGMARRGWAPTVVCSRIHADRLRELEARRGCRLDVTRVRSARERPEGMGRHLLRLGVAVATHAPVLGSTGGRNALLYAPALARTFDELRPDVVHAHFGPNGVAASVALRGRTPLVVDFHGYDFTSYTRATGWDLYRRTLGSAAIVVHSTFAAARVGEHLGRPVRHVTLGVDPSVFSGAERGPLWGSPLRLLLVGRLIAAKGVHVAIRALAELRSAPRPTTAELRVVGDGPERSRLEALARELGVGEAVRFAGALPHDRVAREMADADVLLVPSLVGEDGWEEAFGRVAIEGLASGLPVIVSRVGGLPETVGDAGWVVPPDDAVALASAIRRVTSAETPAGCDRTSRVRAARFSIDRMWDEYADVAAEAAAQSRRQPPSGSP